MRASDDRLEAAHHEAGHAVAAELMWVVGLPARRVRRVVLALAGTGVTILETPPRAPAGPAQTAALVVFTLAGPLAQSRFRRRPISTGAIGEGVGGGEGDVAAAERLCAGLACGPRWRDVCLEHLFEETLRLAHDPAFWPSVDDVAAALGREGSLTGADVRAHLAAVDARMGGVRTRVADVSARGVVREARRADSGIPLTPR